MYYALFTIYIQVLRLVEDKLQIFNTITIKLLVYHYLEQYYNNPN